MKENGTLNHLEDRDESMVRVYLADAQTDERTALRLMLMDLKMDVVGEATSWAATLTKAPASRLDMLLVNYDLLPKEPNHALLELRKAVQGEVFIILITNLGAHQQAVHSAGADACISKGEAPERVAEDLMAAAKNVRV